LRNSAIVQPCYTALTSQPGKPVLLELRVENYAVIDNLAVEFAPGLNLLTGETGAGKSILIDALALLLGEKASSEVIRHGAEKAMVSAVFEVEQGQVKVALEANGLDAAGDGGHPGHLIVRREIAAGGKGRVFINNQSATVAVLRQMAAELASIHAQSESIRCFDAAARLELLDQFAGADDGPVARRFERWSALRAQLAELEQNEQDRLRALDLWSFQKKEIEQARLEPGEDERLETEKRVLANAEKLYAAAAGGYDLLYDSSSSSLAALRAAQRNLEELARYDPAVAEQVTQLEAARVAIEDVSAMLRDYAERIHASPERLSEVEDRLALLASLKRKYGRQQQPNPGDSGRLEQVLAYKDDVTRKLEEWENREETLKRLRRELAAAAGDYLEAARLLSRRRREAAKRLEKRVEAEVNELAMSVRFKVEIASGEAEENWTRAGLDSATCLIATNPGEPLKPVEQIASGGELSRVMLALKTAVNQADSARPGQNGGRNQPQSQAPQRTLVFDEIDSGIGGRAAEAVGRKLKSLARHNQVLCVTHLPQIAAFADHHYLVEKREVGGRSQTRLRRLDAAQRAEEIARMLSGARLTDSSRRHAQQLLKTNT